MFESPERLAGEIGELLAGIRGLAGGRYACLLTSRGVFFESADAEAPGTWALRRFLEERKAALFTIPGTLEGGGPAEDIFAGWDEDEFFLAFINGRVALVVACPEAEPLRERALNPVRALVDRLFRYDETFRLDAQGRGLFLGSAKLDLVVIGRAEG